jgi:pimeloyl-ACP methyl ester carboxylesterase
VPMTIRIPLPAGISKDIDWSHPRREDFAVLNGQIQDIDSAAVFMHGYQSDRRVWTTDMQQFMDLSPEPTIGIAFAGMGSEGDFLGSGDSPLAPKQYAFDTMEALDRLGLYGKDLTVYGHSLGGAAALQMGLATDRMMAKGGPRPDVDYVLLEPAPSGDSVPFLTRGLTSALISVQNEMGSWPNPDFTTMTEPVITGPALATLGNLLVGGAVVADLMPGAPDYIQGVHSSFAATAGFPQLKATAAGLVTQAEPDPAEVAAFMRNNHVLVVAGAQDKIVSTDAVLGLFDGHVLVVPGNHYAHLPSTIADQNVAASLLWPRIQAFLNPRERPAHGPR